MSPGPDYIEIINPRFLTTLQGILAVLEDDVAPIIPENIYLTLVNDLQMLYSIHDASSSANTSNGIHPSISSTINNNNNNTNTNNIANFSHALTIVETMYDNMSHIQRNTAYENVEYNNHMTIAQNLWQSLSHDMQRDYRSNMHNTNILYGGPVHRIVYPRS
jgi:hypothetical protein